VPVIELVELSREVGEVQRLIDQMVDARLLVVQTLEGGKDPPSRSSTSRWSRAGRPCGAGSTRTRTTPRWSISCGSRRASGKGKGYDQGLLWRGDSAAEARKFRMRYKGPLSDVERGFLDAVIYYDTAQARRRRTAIIAGFTTLSMIVVAAMILLVIVQKSRTAAKENERRALDQQHLAEERLDQTEKANAAREAAQIAQQTAEHATAVVTEQKAVVDTELLKSKEDLIKERDAATDSAQEATRARFRAEENEKLADHSRKEALAAQDDTARANKELQQALDKERDRVLFLENTIGSKPVSDLKK